VQYVVLPKASPLLPDYLFIIYLFKGLLRVFRNRVLGRKFGPKIQRSNTRQKIIA
jgi:hypothetical protein